MNARVGSLVRSTCIAALLAGIAAWAKEQTPATIGHTAGSIAAEEIAAIRTRSQLLRSHALAQRAVQSHSGH